MSGHSKWSTIKRKKAANDAKRGNLFTRFAREITIAAREGGGELDTNFALRLVVDRAKASNMPKDNIERAIKRGTGEDKDAAVFEQIMYEAYAPHGVALMIDVVTDNRNRTIANLRHCLTRAGGNIAELGSVSWQFRRVAYFAIDPKGVGPDLVFDAAVEAGADDVSISEDVIEIIAPVEAFKNIDDQLSAANIKPDEKALQMFPNTTLQLSKDKTIQVMRVIESLEELDEVRDVFHNLDITDEAVAMLEPA
jgi:YebC/PmpR family DNA-binding regulatory protein